MDLILAFAEQVEGADIAEMTYYFLERKDYCKIAKIQDKLNYNDKIDLITKIADSCNFQLCAWAIKNLNPNDYYKDILKFAMKSYANTQNEKELAYRINKEERGRVI